MDRPPAPVRAEDSIETDTYTNGDVMTHTWTLALGRTGGIRLVNCSGELAPLARRPAWVSNAAERLVQCQDCGAVLGLVGDSVDWTMSAADWKSLGQ